MIYQPSLSLRLVDGCTLGKRYRAALRPGELFRDRDGQSHRLPRYFYEVPSWVAALQTQLTSHFGLWELIDVDVREAEVLRTYPRYIPCAITLLATHLEVLRSAVGGVVRVAANGGYRSPAHAFSRSASTHCWGSAANVYRVGDEYLDDQEKIEKYNRLARNLLPGIWTRPYGTSEGYAFDHVHLDLGYVTVVPPDADGEEDADDS
ncbi:MAG TPA: hypothetical protein VGR27_08430 [Longimicrobiaceae bacterium]|nr:hypothetical protein [Longimicrobiaceae bacterium]